MIKKISIKLLCLLGLLAVLSVLYRYTFFESDYQAYAPSLVQIENSVDSADIYYFGESSNTTFVPEDSTYASISSLTSMFYPKLYLKNINKEATHAGIYRKWLGVFDKMRQYPKALVVTMNLRAFNAGWIYSDLEGSLQEGAVFANPYPALINRFLLSLQAFPHLSKEESEKKILEDYSTKSLYPSGSGKYHTVRAWDDAMANGGYLKADGSWDMDKIVLACHYIKGYGLTLDENNKRVQDFDEIVNWCDRRQVKLYFNLMAENVHYADSLVGKDLVFLMRQNRDFLMRRYNGKNCTMVDNLEAVEGKFFIDQAWTTEHYRYPGRMKIAANLALALKQQFKSEYIKAY